MKKLAILWLMLAVATMAAAASKPKKEAANAQTVDAGSYGIFVDGKRVGTEKFVIAQGAAFSTITTEMKTEGGEAEQHSELQLTPSGDLRRYEWQEVKPGKAQAVVEPSNEFLIEHVLPNQPEKPQDIPFLVSASTLILEDNIFIHRQVLAWRYIASGYGGGPCEQVGTEQRCKVVKSSFGVLVPKQGVSDSVLIQFMGKEKVTLKGAERELSRFDIASEQMGQWTLWLDEQNKMVRVLVPSSRTEVVRD